MIRGRVLVIDGDASNTDVLARTLREKGYEVDVCGAAVGGYQRAIDTVPDCVVLSPELPDIDGAWVARKIRTESSSIAKIPILFVGDLADQRVRAQTLNVGADVFLARPVSNEEIAAQIDALIAMARRLSAPGVVSAEAVPSSSFAAIRGDLSAFPLASMLMMFEMERRSGLIELVGPNGKRATLALSGGSFAHTEIDGHPCPAIEALREVLPWRVGRFSFQPRESDSLPEPRASVGALVLEAMRLEDEENSLAVDLNLDELSEGTVKE